HRPPRTTPFPYTTLFRSGQRNAKRPVGRLEATAVQQHDSVVLGQTEGEIERVDVLLEVFDRVLADVLSRPELEVDQAVVGIEQRSEEHTSELQSLRHLVC